MKNRFAIESHDTAAFDYHLPESAIALNPVTPRSQARLLRYANGEINTRFIFEDLPDLLPPGAQLWINDTRVIRARLILTKPTGGRLELFLLEPMAQTMEQALASKGPVVWRCLVRGVRRWKSGEASLEVVSQGSSWRLKARLEAVEQGTCLVQLNWHILGESGEMLPMEMSQLLEAMGRVPLPPYLQREDEPKDVADYQTVYAETPGSVAAPTAGLHYDDRLMDRLSQRTSIHRVTLHVGAGTFKPLGEGPLSDHLMHTEQCHISHEALLALTEKDVHRVATGTTTLRTLESVYWLILKWKACGTRPDVLHQWEWAESLEAIDRELKWDMATAMRWALPQMEGEDWEFSTSIMMIPSYRIRSCKGLVTNFHLPKSTLLCLVAAAIGESWRDVYADALTREYRFLSYGDGSYLDIES